MTIPPVAARQQRENDEKPPLSTAATFWYSIASIGCGVFFSFNNFILPLFLKHYTQDNRLLGIMGSSHSVEGAVIQPFVGSMSDRLRSRWGRRRPFMLIFFPLSALFMLLTPVAASLPPGIRLAAIVLCVFLFTVCFNIGFDPYRALMPDITPEKQRGRVTSVWAFVGVIGQTAIVFLPLPISLKFGVVAAIMVLSTLLTCWKTSEPSPPELPDHHKSHAAEIMSALRGLKTLRQAAKGLLVFFLSGLGIGAVIPFLTLFVESITGCSDAVAQKMPLILMGTTALAVLPCGYLADKMGAKSMVMASMVLIAMASLLALGVNTLTEVSAVLVLAGLGNAALSAANYPLMTEIIPSQEVGLYTGLLTTMESIAQPVTVVATGAMINAGSYRVIFGVCAVSMLAALAVLATVDKRRAKVEVTERTLALETA